MTDLRIDREEIEWPKGFDGARVASLLHFASLTPDQRLQWLCDTLAFMREIRAASHTQIDPAQRRP